MSIVKRAPLIAAGLAALAMSSAALADAIVVRSTGPSAATYPVGRRLPATQRVVLRAGDRVVLVGEGPSRTLSGPGNFPVRSANQANQTSTGTLGRYLSATGSTIRRTGAVRGTGATVSSPPNLWVVNFARGGTMCVTDPANVTLWRSDMSEDTLLTVENTANPGQSSTLAFVQGQNFRRWPNDAMPIAPGASYRITGPGMDSSMLINFVTLSEVPDNAETVANMLAERGCMAQLEQLGDYLAETSPAQ